MISWIRFYVLPQGLWSAIQRFCIGWFSTAGAELTFIELLRCCRLYDKFNMLQETRLKWFLIVFPFIIGCIRYFPKREVVATIAGTDIRVSCKVCDIFTQTGDIVIATNTTFDTSTENDFISSNSLQGQFQKKYFGKKNFSVSKLDEEIVNALKNEKPTAILTDGRNTKVARYSVGTVAKLPSMKRFPGIRFRPYLLALATSTPSGSACTTVDDFAEAIQKLWCFLWANGYKTKLCVPLLGTGRSGLNCSRMVIAKEIIFSFVAYSRSSRIIDELQICISPHDYTAFDMNLNELQDYLNVVTQNDSLYHSSSVSRVVSVPIS